MEHCHHLEESLRGLIEENDELGFKYRILFDNETRLKGLFYAVLMENVFV